MTLSTTTAAFNLTPVVINTFIKHYAHFLAKEGRRVRGRQEDEVITDEILFDEAFHIVKGFLQLGMENRVEDLQSFTNTHIPAPFWTTVIPVLIPLSSCNAAADVLISHFTPDEMKRVVGGERWWQVRGIDGVEAEWVAMKSDWQRIMREKKKGRTADDTYDASIDRLDRVMLYIHGGGYYFGSINTHRYQITRFARKIGGRAFAVNYRKAPQYPWPCPLQDCLAAYLYLIDPPPGAPHTAVDPRHIVFAGDSAGGGIALALLTIIRGTRPSPVLQPTPRATATDDATAEPHSEGDGASTSTQRQDERRSKTKELPMPSGAVLISPWVDLTHSFPSVMENTDTDIIPPHGFIHKPSTIWPVPVASSRTERSKARPTLPDGSEHTSISSPGSKSSRKWPSLRKRSRSGSRKRPGVIANQHVIPVSDSPNPNDGPSGSTTSPSPSSAPSHTPEPTSSSSSSGNPSKGASTHTGSAPHIGIPTDTLFTSVKRRTSGNMPFSEDSDVQGKPKSDVDDDGHGETRIGRDPEPGIGGRATMGEEGSRYTTAPDPQSPGRSPTNPALIKVPFTPEPEHKRRSVFWGRRKAKASAGEKAEPRTVELKAQIQLYATNEQLIHPLVSPLLQPSLGGLPPLYILAGDGERLRDEVVYLAHRCAEPTRYKLSPRHDNDDVGGVDDGGGNTSEDTGGNCGECTKARRRESAAEMDARVKGWDSVPTQVHLQVFDGMCHVPTVFTFCDGPKYAYRSIAAFIKHVTKTHIEPGSHLPSTPKHADSAPVSVADGSASVPSTPHKDASHSRVSEGTPAPRSAFPNTSLGRASIDSSPGIVRYAFFGTDTAVPSEEDLPAHVEGHAHSSGAEDGTPKSKKSSGLLFRRRKGSRSSPAVVQSSTSSVEDSKRAPISSIMAVGGAGLVRTDSPAPLDDSHGPTPQRRDSEQSRHDRGGEVSSSFGGGSGEVVIMKRERVDVRGRVRLMEPPEEIPALQLDPRRIGIVAEAPVKRWLQGHDLWDRRYHRTAEHVEKERKKNEWIAEEVLKQARDGDGSTTTSTRANAGHRWSPLDLEDEHPPPSAIAGRRDNPDSLALLKVSVDYTHPSLIPVPPVLPSNIRQKLERTLTKPGGAGREPSRQSAAEQQVKSLPMHGLNMWSDIAGHFTDRAKKGKDNLLNR